MKKATPKDIRCVWTARKGERGVYDCYDCGSWTANMPLYRATVCPAKERRKGGGDLRPAIDSLMKDGTFERERNTASVER
jgi:hypothetical protein